ncbi:MAG: DUF3499 domain-containing protein [Ornithinimicrobium sp.]
MTISRQCSRTACGRSAVATLTYVYAEQTAVLGPLATYAEPHSYDLCSTHGIGLTAPRGWEIVRLDPPEGSAPPADDLVALAEAVRERRQVPSGPSISAMSSHRADSTNPAISTNPAAPGVIEGTRRGHLRVLRDR